ncbi:hypothetical protein Tco_1017300 [Tanacetum coccineum]|uniref:Uncharacterized protein n=1 Tax=Tanacetum coccineum TaxID=301880 RepID=A0ABQ5FSB7_9ASTR
MTNINMVKSLIAITILLSLRTAGLLMAQMTCEENHPFLACAFDTCFGLCRMLHPDRHTGGQCKGEKLLLRLTLVSVRQLKLKRR